MQDYTTDPDNPITGQVWYNETANTLKFQYEITAGAWSTGNNVNSARRFLAGAGAQTAALIFGGEVPGGSGTAIAESYNGTNWTETGDLNNARVRIGGVGADNTAVLAFGGGAPPPGYKAFTESFN